MPPSAAGVIFDMDGVLIDSADAHRRAWQALGREIGVPFSDELFSRTFGQRNATIIPAWLGAVPRRRQRALDERKEAIYRDVVRHGAVRVYRRIPALLHELRDAGARIAIASSGPRANVDLLVEVIGAEDVVDASVAAEDVSRGKPDPEVFVRSAERLALPPPRCAVIEDSVHGIEGAKRAGMLAVAVLTSTAKADLVAAGADVCIGEAGDLDVAWLVGRLTAAAA
jgi:beta-phosphoglucomutase